MPTYIITHTHRSVRLVFSELTPSSSLRRDEIIKAVEEIQKREI